MSYADTVRIGFYGLGDCGGRGRCYALEGVHGTSVHRNKNAFIPAITYTERQSECVMGYLKQDSRYMTAPNRLVVV